MTLKICDDGTAASWLLESRTPLEQLITFGPIGFECYARLRYIPDPTHSDQDESDALVPDDHIRDFDQAMQALNVLKSFTARPDAYYFCVWDGYSDFRAEAGSVVDLQDREYVLARGDLNDWHDWAWSHSQGHSSHPPAFVWPVDHVWCFASDVDPHRAGIGATAEAVTRLKKHPLLDVVHAWPENDQPRYR